MKRDWKETLMVIALALCVCAQGVVTILLTANLGFRF